MKAILVVDMPTICSNCILEQNAVINHKSYSYCGACGIATKHGHLLEDCPLKAVSLNNLKIDVVSHDRFVEGWNHCVKSILGETE